MDMALQKEYGLNYYSVSPIGSEFVQKCMRYAYRCVNETMHEYDGQHYSVHLAMVWQYAKEYGSYYFDERGCEIVEAAAWVHDVIEDNRQTYNDVLKVCGKEVAEVVFALTNEKGRTRKERANDKYYSVIKHTKYATFVKLCDRLANVKYSKEKGSDMFEVYKMEWRTFTEKLYNSQYDAMFNELKKLCTLPA